MRYVAAHKQKCNIKYIMCSHCPNVQCKESAPRLRTPERLKTKVSMSQKERKKAQKESKRTDERKCPRKEPHGERSESPKNSCVHMTTRSYPKKPCQKTQENPETNHDDHKTRDRSPNEDAADVTQSPDKQRVYDLCHQELHDRAGNEE